MDDRPAKAVDAQEPLQTTVTAGFDPDDVTGWTLVRAYQKMARRFAATFAEVDLTPTHFGVLLHLDRYPGTSQAAIARSVFISPQAMGEVLTALQSKGLVVRAGGHVGRATAVALTDAGREALRQAVPRIAAVNRPEMLGLTGAEDRTLNGLLHRVRRALDEPNALHPTRPASDAEDWPAPVPPS